MLWMSDVLTPLIVVQTLPITVVGVAELHDVYGPPDGLPIDAYRAPSRVACVTLIYALSPKPKSMIPKTKIMKSGTIIANSTRLCAPCFLCSLRSIGYVLPDPDTGGTP